MPEIQNVLDRMSAFTDEVRSGAWTGFTGKRIVNIVNIGIGGSRPRAGHGLTEALKPLLSIARSERPFRVEHRWNATFAESDCAIVRP